MHVTCPKCKRRIKFKKSRKGTFCKCGYEFKFSDYYDSKKLYLADSNVFLYSRNRDERRGKACWVTLNQDNVATTDKVVIEIGGRIPQQLENFQIFQTGKISKKVAEIKTNNVFKQPSETDFSIVQTAINNPQIAGIITYDNDFESMATVGLIEKYNKEHAPKFWVGNAYKFLIKRRVWKKK